MGDKSEKIIVEGLAEDIKALKKQVGNNTRDIHHLQTEAATKKIVLDGLAGDDKSRVERIELANKFLNEYYPALKVNVVNAFRLPKKGDKPAKMIVTLDSAEHVTHILHVKKPRNPPNGRNGVFVGPELSRLAQEAQFKKRQEKRHPPK